MKMPDETQTQGGPIETPFAFGDNWAHFLAHIDEDRIQIAEESLRRLIGKDDFNESLFLDAGSGSGLFSLAAHRLGMSVTSFDVDPDSVGCTQELKRRYCQGADNWEVFHGSLLDQAFLETLGKFDVVYCWGVVHHTGNLWVAIENLLPLVKPDGSLVLAIYNDQLYISRAWRGVKRIYQQMPVFIRPLYVVTIGLSTFAKRFGITFLACSIRLCTLRNPIVPLKNWISETQSRGMHGWYDLVDWVGGWPFEVARPEEVFRFVRDRGFTLKDLTTSVGHGCNEFAFTRNRNGRS